jgi:hypothetical protein
MTWGETLSRVCQTSLGTRMCTVDSRLSAVMVGRIGADNQNQRINRSTHTQARYTGIQLISLIFYAINRGLTPDRFMTPCWAAKPRADNRESTVLKSKT